jgi:leucyl/phenylalanyl-tRNA--protein transferase
MSRLVNASMILSERLQFPDANSASREGLVAIGGDLSPARLLLAYRQGIFPWTVDPITWWSPDPRAIFELEQFHIPRSLQKILRRQPFLVTFDRAFQRVMEACGTPAPGREQSWVTPEFIAAYSQLHEQGYAHSVECWRGSELVGGVYGVCLGGFFAGESMFHRADHASKVALCHLVFRLRERGFELFDIQMMTPTTRLLGAREIARDEYLRRLRRALKKKCTFR